ncbi:hypothetical protein QYM36_016421 [Artemia franciscana]|uniref:Uncharacterized protein n=1 Tax=Artemia franciscana TaxID=6661 RepID=A0AA88HG37_ARTSF|nr:hypothetical protein QYM36_016421 [Artemia franciscana]
MSAEVTELKTHSSSRDSKTVSHQKDSILQKARCKELQKNLLDFKGKERQLNIIIHGLLSECPSQNTKSNIENLFENHLALQRISVHMTKCYRLPDKPASGIALHKRPKTRTVLISLHNELKIQSVLKSDSKLKGSGICIATDLPPVLNNLRYSLLIKGKSHVKEVMR